jgi:hypothetical protein
LLLFDVFCSNIHPEGIFQAIDDTKTNGMPKKQMLKPWHHFCQKDRRFKRRLSEEGGGIR